MASLQARSPLRSAHPLLFVNKAVSLTAFLVLLGAGWIALSYLKSDFVDRWQGGAPRSAAASVAVPVEQTASNSRVAAPSRLVYSCVEIGTTITPQLTYPHAARVPRSVKKQL